MDPEKNVERGRKMHKDGVNERVGIVGRKISDMDKMPPSKEHVEEGLAPNQGELAIVYHDTPTGPTQHMVTKSSNISPAKQEESSLLGNGPNHKYANLHSLYSPVYTSNQIGGEYAFPKVKFSSLIFPWSAFMAVIISYVLSCFSWYYLFYDDDYRLVLAPFVTSSIVCFFESPVMLAKYLFRKMRRSLIWRLIPMGSMIFHSLLLLICSVPINLLYCSYVINKGDPSQIFNLPMHYLVLAGIQATYIFPCILFLVAHSRFEAQILKDRTEYDHW
ncbi:transmembrane domain-containing protein [Cryptosporidium canis]|uniref:Transmembrane domain-containing protein n=1 Tax=Cryptosporidium canis TaxID=195482 RepID=A0ABQ8P9L5_9CRYT|nr:transmembrane domain-containing protein [Cryptosporidium canis]KAJ1613687.1 transmembrane domain-containing protein [Cryptosporidium canis]